MTIGHLEGTLTRQYQIRDLVETLANTHSGMRVDEIQAALDAGHDAHTGLAERLVQDQPSGGTIENELLRACWARRSDARLMVWAGLLIADHRLADVVETFLTDWQGHIRQDAFDARQLRPELERRGYGSAQKASSNLLRYFETSGLLEAERHGSMIVGIERQLSTVHAVPGVVDLVRERVLDLEGIQVQATEAVSFTIERRVHHWLLLSVDEFARACVVTSVKPSSPIAPASTPGSGAPAESEGSWEGFKPKSDTDYVSHVATRVMTKSRLHETIVNAYARWAEGNGLRPTSPHPIDLSLTRDGARWLVEAKVVYRGNATYAVRAALGQLLTYRHFLYDDSVGLVALFSESVGAAYVAFLEELGIASVWREEDRWHGSSGALAEGLADGP